MKRIVTIVIALLVISCGLVKASDASFIYLLGTDTVNVNLDYSRLKTPAEVQEDFSAILERNTEIWQVRFLTEMNDSNRGWNLRFGTFDSRYTVLVQFISVGSNASLKTIFRIIDMHTISEKHAQVVEVRGGIYGTFEELLGESIQRLGEEIGDIIKDNME